MADKSPSVYSSALTETGVVFSRMYWSFKNSWSVIEAMSVSFEGDIIQSGYTYSFDTAEHGVVLAVSPTLGFGSSPGCRIAHASVRTNLRTE